MSSTDDLFVQARAALAGDLPEVPATDGSESLYAGTSTDGQVRAAVAADGRVQTLDIDPDAMRQPLDDVLAAAAEAINAARDARPGQLDLSGALELVGDLQAVARNQLVAFADATDGVEARVRTARASRPTT